MQVKKDNLIKKSSNGIILELSKMKNLLNITINTHKFEDLSELIEKRFELKCGKLEMDITGEQVFKKCKTKNYTISIGYGKWYPFAILSEVEKSNKLIEEIFDWLETIEIPV